jgi:hypothetical protein
MKYEIGIMNDEEDYQKVKDFHAGINQNPNLIINQRFCDINS